MPKDDSNVIEVTSLTLRSYFSITYLQTARFLAERAASLEADKSGYTMVQVAEHQGAVSASILMSVAGIEAYINEFFADAADGHSYFLVGLTDQEIRRLARAWESAKSIERAEVLEKYRLACMFLDRPFMDRGTASWQDVEIGIAMRNALMHFKPQSVELSAGKSQAATEREWKSVGAKLRGRPIKPNPLSLQGQPDFPYRLLSASCAEWICESARTFIQQFARHIGLADLPLNHNTHVMAMASR